MMPRALAVLVVLAPAAARADGHFQRDVVNVAPHDGTAITAVAVDNQFGNVTVIGHDGPDLIIKSEKLAPDEASLERLKVSFVPDPTGPIAIRTSLAHDTDGGAIRAGSVRIDLVIMVPRGARVDATVWNGAIDVRGVDNGASLTVNEGDIAVENATGDVTTYAALGTQRIERVYGAVAAEGVGGQLELLGVEGRRLQASMHTGPITATRVRSGEVVMRTFHGDIRFDGELLPGGHYDLRAYRGDVEITFRSGASLRVEALARAGNVELPRELRPHKLGDGKMVGTYGGGSKPAGVVVTSRHGDVRVGIVPDPK